MLAFLMRIWSNGRIGQHLRVFGVKQDKIAWVIL